MNYTKFAKTSKSKAIGVLFIFLGLCMLGAGIWGATRNYLYSAFLMLIVSMLDFLFLFGISHFCGDDWNVSDTVLGGNSVFEVGISRGYLTRKKWCNFATFLAYVLLAALYVVLAILFSLYMLICVAISLCCAAVAFVKYKVSIEQLQKLEDSDKNIQN